VVLDRFEGAAELRRAPKGWVSQIVLKPFGIFFLATWGVFSCRNLFFEQIGYDGNGNCRLQYDGDFFLFVNLSNRKSIKERKMDQLNGVI
jgi:hypothetical protein